MTRAATSRRRLRPDTRAFSAFLALLAALPTFGIDMVLPSLPATTSTLGAPSSETGLAMSAYLLSLGATLLVFGPLSDRFGRKPIIAWGCGLLIAGSVGCMLATSFPQFLACRALQGIGAAGPGVAGLAVVRDVFDDVRARAQMSFVVGVTNVVPMVAPSGGAALLVVGDWRLIHAAPIVAALILLVVLRFFDETAPIEARREVRPTEVVRGYARVMTNPICLGNSLCNAGAAASVFAYITGSSLVFIEGLGVSPTRYGLIFGASSLSVMGGAFVNGRLAARNVPAVRAIELGLGLASGSAVMLLAATASGARSPGFVVLAMVGMALAFGLLSPNAVQGATRPYPEIAGSVSAVAIFLQLLGAGAGSDLVARFFDGRSALSMAGVMLASCVVATASYALLARRAALRADAPQPRPASAEAKGEPA